MQRNALQLRFAPAVICNPPNTRGIELALDVFDLKLE
jgi:hypothetical protein